MELAKSERAEYEKLLAELEQRSGVYMKLSSVIHRVAGAVSTELGAYRDRIDSLMDVFGEDRVIFGSDWPNSDGVASLVSIVRLAREYLATQPLRVAEKVLLAQFACHLSLDAARGKPTELDIVHSHPP
ncbi:MAG: amidohydrolase family protein [Pirellulaceae bacterium]